MKTIVIAIYDQKANVFTQPFTAPSKGVAVRSWGDQLNDPENKKSDQVRHPEDFSLYYLGEYDDQHGTFNIADKPQQLAVASSLVVEKA